MENVIDNVCDLWKTDNIPEECKHLDKDGNCQCKVIDNYSKLLAACAVESIFKNE